MVSLLVDVYQATGNLDDLELASRLGDWLTENQDEDGAYRAGGHGPHYTCVAYAAKSMLELAAVLVEDPDRPNRPQGKHVEQVIGEQYVEMISHFWHPPVDKAVFGYPIKGMVREAALYDGVLRPAQIRDK